MKVDKKHTSLSKGNGQTAKWVRNGKSAGTSPQSDAQADVLKTTCGKTDVLLSKAQLVTSLQQPIIWPEKGILRQALLSGDKTIKCEKTDASESQTSLTTHVPVVNTSLVTISVTPQPPLFTSVGSSVIMMSDIPPQLILSGESLSLPAVSWQSAEKKDSELACVSACTVPIVTSRHSEQDSALLVDENVTYPALGAISVLNTNNVLPTLLTKEGKNPLKGNPLINAGFNIALPDNKKSVKIAAKDIKVKRKVNSEKQILLKPSSSLLSSLALNYSLEGSKPVLNLVTSTNNVLNSTDLLEAPDFTSASSSPRIIMSDVTLATPVSTSSVIITSSSTSNNFSSPTPEKCQVVNLSDLNIEKNNYSHLTSGQTLETENHILYHSNDNMLHHSSEVNPIPMTPTTIQNHIRIINLNSEAPLTEENVLTQSSNRIISTDNPAIMHPRIMTPTQELIHHSGPDLITENEFHRDSDPVILSTDIDHNAEPSSHSGYTESLLSQLSSEGALPTMSSSQVSSVLSALEPKAQQMNELVNLENCSKVQKNVKNELETTEYEKVEKTNPDDEKWMLCKQTDHVCYRCTRCMYLSLDKVNVIEHYNKEHNRQRSEIVTTQLKKKPITCFGCENIFYSIGSVMAHLTLDHEIIMDEEETFRNILRNNKSCNRTPSISVSKTRPPPPNRLVHTNIVPRVNSPRVVEVDANSEPHPAAPIAVQSPATSFNLFSSDNVPPEKEISEESNKNVEESEMVKKRGRPKGNVVLKYISKRVKLNDMKTESKPCIMYRCNINGCVAQFSTEENLQFHRQCHAAENPGTFICPNCTHITTQWSSMALHLWKEHQMDMDLYSCTQCNYKTNSYSKLVNQHSRIHGVERPYLCDLCGKGFKTTKQLRNHKVIHRARVKSTNEINAAESDTPVRGDFPCKVCDRSFVTARIQRQHVENVHNKIRKFLCSFCGHGASSRSSLRMHIRQHTGEKPFGCDQCEYTTSDHNSLRRHKMRHTGTYPYSCPHCDYACIQSTTYKTHLKNKHPGMNEGIMFDCPDCSFRTVKKENFLTHKAEHLEGDPRMRRKNHTNLGSIIANEDKSEDSKTVLNSKSSEDNVEMIVPD